MVLARMSVVFLSFSSFSFAASSFFLALSLTFLACRRTSREAGSGESLCFFLLFFFLFIVPLIIIDFSSTGDWRSVGVIIPCHYYSSFVSTDVSRLFQHWRLATGCVYVPHFLYLIVLCSFHSLPHLPCVR